MSRNRRTFLWGLAAASVTAPVLALWPRTAKTQAHHGQVHQGTAPTVQPNNENTLVFAAATLKPALDEVVKAYKSSGGADVTVAYGPTPVLAKNITDGAPADVFFSADTRWMDYLADHNLIRAETRVAVVGNEVVFVQGGDAAGAPAITIGPAFPIAQAVGSGPLAMCNPDSHPAGRYGKTSLQDAGLWDAIASKIAIVENPQIAAAMVARGDAPAAVVFATDIHGLKGVRVVGTFAEPNDAPIVYPAAVTTGAPHPANAGHFLMYLRAPPARQIFDRFGYR
jgi:molybdate transport system substrate-binding protein